MTAGMRGSLSAQDGLSVELRDAKMTDPDKAGLFVRETKVS